MTIALKIQIAFQLFSVVLGLTLLILGVTHHAWLLIGLGLFLEGRGVYVLRSIWRGTYKTKNT